MSLEVYWARDSIGAHAVRALLEDAGIDARVENELLQGAAGEIPTGPSISPRVRVAGEDASRALELIEAWQAERSASARQPVADWICARCGESVEGDIDICWNCSGDEKRPRREPPPPPDPRSTAVPPPPPPSTTSRWRKGDPQTGYFFG